MANKKGGKTGAYKETQRKCFKKKGVGERYPKRLRYQVRTGAVGPATRKSFSSVFSEK